MIDNNNTVSRKAQRETDKKVLEEVTGVSHWWTDPRNRRKTDVQDT